MIIRLITYLAISVILVGTSYCLESTFLSDFLIENIVLIIITLLAINTATYGFIVSKMDEIISSAKIDPFEEARSEIKKSLVLQLYLIAGAVVVSILATSRIIVDLIPNHQLYADFLLVFAFVFSLDLLRDTGYAIFSLRSPKKE